MASQIFVYRKAVPQIIVMPLFQETKGVEIPA